MKIERVRFDNINSLGGHFELDFTHPSLADAGIFVITGPTGAGKTSLLDAITYAIYGQTARQGRVTASSNEIMTHGARFCRAEAVVEKDGVRYLFSTEQKRKQRVRSENAPSYTTAERRVSRIAADGTLTLLSADVSGVKQVADELMKYANFHRCMMLAQGDFARFLRSDAKERSEALATITGTEIYQRIGEKVQERVAGLKSAITAVALLPVKEAGQRAATEQRRDEQAARCQELQAQLDTLTRALNWHSACAAAATARSTRAAEQEQAQREQQQFEEEGHPARIKAAEAAQAIRPLELSRNSTARTLAATQQSLANEQAWLQQHPDTELKNAATQAEEALAARQPGLEQQLRFLADTVQPLEDAISKAEVAAQAATTTAATRAREAADAAATARKAERAAETAAQAQQDAEKALAQLAPDAALAESLPAIRQRLADWQKCPQAGEELPDTASLTARIDAEAAERAALLAGRRREELPLHRERLEGLARLVQKKDEAATLGQTCAREAAQAAQALAALPSIPEAENACNAARERAQLAYKIQTISGKLNELYREFRAGKLTHCPCCGSPQPHERHVQADEDLRDAQQAEQAARQELAARQKAAEHARTTHATAEARLNAARQTAEQLEQEYSKALHELGWETLPDDLAEQSEQLHRNIRRLEELDALRATLDALQRQDACRLALHEALRPCTAEQPATLAAAGGVVARLEGRQKSYTNAAQRVEKTTRDAAVAREGAERTQAEATKAAQNHGTAQTAAADAQRSLNERREALAALWQGGSARQAAEALHAERDTLQQACQKSRDALQAFLTQRESHAALANAAEAQLPQHRREAEQAAASFDAALREHGFADEAAYTAATLPPAALEQLRALATGLAQKLAAAIGALRQAREQEDALRQQALSNESPEELTRQKDAVSGVLHEQKELYTATLAELRQDDDAREANKQKEAELAGTRAELEQWQRLYDILGNAKDGFKKYAQRITFNLLLVQANARLRLLSERYTLVQDEREELGLRVIDRYQDDDKGRSCSNLSGGESFIVSLALALGLAQMAGETRIDTLFLDEGFGTLDEDALEQVLGCLQSLRASGKLIGIISHVEALKERIPANLELLPRGVTGLSTIAAHEAVVAEPV